jgi:putative nucleotidyltransferase with HDIG domain
MDTPSTETDVEKARVLAGALLAGLPDRWRHTQAVAAQARAACPAVAPEDRAVLVSAAWLHDIGYADSAEHTGFHPLDGARMAEQHGWPGRIAALIAHHSGAWFTARRAGRERDISQYPDEASAVTDALVYADQTTGPHGERMDVEARIDESLTRHGPGSLQVLVAAERVPYLLDAVGRVERRLAQSTRR